MYNDLNKNFRSGLSGRLDPAEDNEGSLPDMKW